MINNVTDLNGKSGRIWLENLPDLLRELEICWSLKILQHFKPLSYNFVAPAIKHDGKKVVIKAGYPNHEILNEINALNHFDGAGCVNLLKSIHEKGVMLLEQLIPGQMLSEISNDQESTTIACHILRKIRKNPPPKEHNFPSTADWSRDFSKLYDHFEGGYGPFPAELIKNAETIFRELLDSSDCEILLHGDLHHFNILNSKDDTWLAIDPKGVIGEPVYDTGAFLRNPYPLLLKETNPGKILARRIDQFADELGFDKERMKSYGYAQAVLAAWWSFEDHGSGWEWWLKCAEILEEL